MMNPGKRSRRTLRIEAEEAIIQSRVFGVLRDRDYELLIEIARIIQSSADLDLARHDPARFRLLRNGVTECQIKGLGSMTENGIRRTLRKYNIEEPEYRLTVEDLKRMKKTGEVTPGVL